MNADAVAAQIKKRNYPAAIKEFGGEILLVGINYDKDAPAGERKHTCVIEKLSNVIQQNGMEKRKKNSTHQRFRYTRWYQL